MKSALFFLVLWLALPAGPAQAADAGTATIVDGHARLLRDTTWYKLVPGAGVRQGDIIDAIGASQVQVELATGDAFYLGGPATLYAAAVPIADDKFTGMMDLNLTNGWLKLVAKAPKTGFRIQFPGALINSSDSIAVIHATPGASELFVESGTAKLAQLDAGGRPGPPQDLNSGEYWGRFADRPPRVERRAPSQFVAAMPRPLLDALPTFKGRYKTARVTLVAEQEITYAEAEPWLAGPYRRTFLRQFAPRLRDRDFRAAVDARITRYPEWDRILHPEKYLPKEPAKTQ